MSLKGYVGVVDKEYNSGTQAVIALLIVNKVPNLPEIAIQSLRLNAKSVILVGYLRENDVSHLRKFENLQFINLSNEAQLLGIAPLGDYQDYNSQDFFGLVQLKWVLFEKIFDNYVFDFLIYSDLDVVWLESPESYLNSIFQQYPHVSVCIQDATVRTSYKSLCMGFVTFKNDVTSRSIIKSCKEQHSRELAQNPYSGDDGVITDYYNQSKDMNSFCLLPQASFPIGLFSSLYLDKSPYLGLRPTNPFIFHANYLVGTKRKAVMMLFALSLKKIKVVAPFELYFNLKTRLFLVPLKKMFFRIFGKSN